MPMQKKVWTIIITSLLLFGCSDSKQMKTLGENGVLYRRKLGIRFC